MAQLPVNFRVLSCIHTVNVSKDLDELEFESAFCLRKVADDAPLDRWSMNEWDADIPIRNLSVATRSSNVACSPPATLPRDRGRKEHYIDLSAPDGSRLAKDGEPIEFTLKYTKPLRRGLNYEVFTPLPYIELHVLQFDPSRLFNACDMLRYRLRDHPTLGVMASLPRNDGQGEDTSIFSKDNLEPEETYRLCVVLGKKGLASRIVKGILKPICWVVINFI